MKKYLFTVFGDFKNEKVITRVIKALTTVVDSPKLKYQHTESVVIFHFGSEVDPPALYDFITGMFFGLSETFILTEISDNMSFFVSNNIKEHLLDLESENEDVVIETNMSKRSKPADDMMGADISDMAEEFVGFLLDEINQEIKVPTLNQILDKINEKGISSLSGFEKEILDEYSKN
jgi:hypothetical protein